MVKFAEGACLFTLDDRDQDSVRSHQEPRRYRVHTLRKQKRHVLSFLRDTITAALHGAPAPSLTPLTP